MATRTELNQILVSFSPTFSSLLHRAKCSRLDGERAVAGLAVGFRHDPVEDESDGLQAGLGEFFGRFEATKRW